MSNPHVFFEIGIDGLSVGTIVFELFADVVPKTAENFRCLCTGEKGRGETGKRLNYLGSKFHRIIPGFVCQAGDFTKGNGTGGESIFGHTFEDENFKMKHDGPGILSMANSGPHSNGSQFFISLKSIPHLDGSHVVFGKVLSGIEVIEKMEQCGSEEGEPTQRVVIQDCGEIQLDDKKATKRAKIGTPSEVVHVLHILRKHSDLKKPSSWREEEIVCSKEDAASFLRELRVQLMKGGSNSNTASRAKFEELAREHSDCKSAKKGGDLGPFERDMMSKAFEAASFALKVGELSDVVSDKSGEHLLLRLS